MVCRCLLTVQLSFLSLQLRELSKENTFLKGQITTLEETINVHEMEAKANRETIMRLAADVSREQKKAASWAAEKDKLNQVLGAGGASVLCSQSRNGGADVPECPEIMGCSFEGLLSAGGVGAVWGE